MGSNVRSANGHRRRQVVARVLREEHDCYLCHTPVDKTIKTPDDRSPEVHEIIPVSRGGSPTHRANVRLTDPVSGSGTTGEACILEGFQCILIERESDYLPLIQQRIDRAHAQHSSKATLFDEVTA